MVEIRHDGKISLRRRSSRHLFHELIDAILVLDDNNCR